MLNGLLLILPIEHKLHERGLPFCFPDLLNLLMHNYLMMGGWILVIELTESDWNSVSQLGEREFPIDQVCASGGFLGLW